MCATVKPRGGQCLGQTQHLAKAAADDECKAIGARMCTLGELERGEARGSGCRLRKAALWSSTPCTPTGGGVGFAVAPQSEKFFGHRRFGSRCVAAESAEAAAVCCCDKA